MRYSFQPRDQLFLKGYGFLSLAKNMGKNIGKNIIKNVSGTWSQEFLDHAKKYATDPLKISSRGVNQKTAEATGNLVSNKIAEAVARSYNSKITRVSKNSQQINSEIVTNEHDKKIPKERYISTEERQDIIVELRLK